MQEISRSLDGLSAQLERVLTRAPELQREIHETLGAQLLTTVRATCANQSERTPRICLRISCTRHTAPVAIEVYRLKRWVCSSPCNRRTQRKQRCWCHHKLCGKRTPFPCGRYVCQQAHQAPLAAVRCAILVCQWARLLSQNTGRRGTTADTCC